MIINKKKLINLSMYPTFGLLSILGLSKLDGFNHVNATIILEGLFLFLSFITIFSNKFKKQEQNFLIISILLISYISISGILAIVVQERNLLDFLREYKAFVYLSLICFYIKHDVFTCKVTKNIFYLLLIVFLLKYTVAILFLGISRPGVFTENNFELSLLCLMYLALSDHLGKYKSFTFIILTIIVILSGSRSGMASLCFLYVGTYLTKLDLKLALKLGLLSILAILSVSLFIDRLTGDISSIDRFRFLLVFIDEIQPWGLVNYLLGTMPITPLHPYSCDTLSYYDALNSFSGDGSCYPVILHSYILRVILVHGLIGLLALLIIYWSLLSYLRLSKIKIFTFVMIALCSAISVSSINSIYFTFGILFLMSTKSWNQEVHKVNI